MWSSNYLSANGCVFFIYFCGIQSVPLIQVFNENHYSDFIMGAIASQTTRLTIVNSTVYSGADQRRHQSSASLAFARWIHRWPVNSPHKWPVTRKMFPFDDVNNLGQCQRKWMLIFVSIWQGFNPITRRGIFYTTLLTGIISYMRPASERRRYIVTSTLIGWAHVQNDYCMIHVHLKIRPRLTLCFVLLWFSTNGFYTCHSGPLHW